MANLILSEVVLTFVFVVNFTDTNTSFWRRVSEIVFIDFGNWFQVFLYVRSFCGRTRQVSCCCCGTCRLTNRMTGRVNWKFAKIVIISHWLTMFYKLGTVGKDYYYLILWLRCVKYLHGSISNNDNEKIFQSNAHCLRADSPHFTVKKFEDVWRRVGGFVSV